jgi:hypothetical protein
MSGPSRFRQTSSRRRSKRSHSQHEHGPQGTVQGERFRNVGTHRVGDPKALSRTKHMFVELTFVTMNAISMEVSVTVSRRAWRPGRRKPGVGLQRSMRMFRSASLEVVPHPKHGPSELRRVVGKDARTTVGRLATRAARVGRARGASPPHPHNRPRLKMVVGIARRTKTVEFNHPWATRTSNRNERQIRRRRAARFPSEDRTTTPSGRSDGVDEHCRGERFAEPTLDAREAARFDSVEVGRTNDHRNHRPPGLTEQHPAQRGAIHQSSWRSSRMARAGGPRRVVERFVPVADADR